MSTSPKTPQEDGSRPNGPQWDVVVVLLAFMALVAFVNYLLFR